MSSAPSRVTRLAPFSVLVLVLIGGLAKPAAAQTPTPVPLIPVESAPIPWFVVDARVGYPSMPQDTLTASSLGIAAIDLPGRARTLVVGAHAYPIRRGWWKVGVGGEMLLGSGARQKKDADGKPAGPEVHRRLNSVSAQISLNFGRGAGWSYVTVGTGPFKFESSLDDADPDGESASTLNFGGGARWFNWDHVAFTVDLRFYLTKPANATANTGARLRQRVVMLSAGFALK